VRRLFRHEVDPGVSLLKIRNEAWIKATIHIASCEAGYRRLVREHILETDGVLELGCHCGTTTALARNLCCGTVVGIDTSDFNLQKARSNYTDADISWVCMDATDSWAVRRECLRAAGIEDTSRGERKPKDKGAAASSSAASDKTNGPEVNSRSGSNGASDSCEAPAGAPPPAPLQPQENGDIEKMSIAARMVEQRRLNRQSRREARVSASVNRRLGQAESEKQVPEPGITREDGTPSVVLLDISGSRAPGLLMSVIESYDRVLKPRMFIVKSYKLYSFVSQSSVAGGGARV